MYTIKNAKTAVFNGIRGYLLKDEQGNYRMREVNRLPFYLEGEPGIGKTEIVKQIADELGIGYVSFSLTHHTRNSLLGLPVIKELEDGDKYTSYTMSEVIAKVSEAVEQGHKEGILLLDEFPCMSETIMPAMLAFLQTKNIGTHHLPEGWVIVLCGNPPKYNKSARTFDAAIVDRLRKLEIQFEPNVFVEYAQQIEMHPCIIEYLKLNNDKVYWYQKVEKQLELVTCRGWENLSHMMKAQEELELDICTEDVKQYLKSEHIANDFYQFYQSYLVGLKEKDMENILNGVRVSYYANKIKDKNYNVKWRMVQTLLNKFTMEISEYKEEKELFTKIQNVSANIKKEIETESFYNYFLGQPCLASELINACLQEIDLWDIDVDVIKKWKCWAEEEFDKKGKKITLEDSEANNEIKELWMQWEQSVTAEVKELEEKAAERLEKIFIFTKKIDTENVLCEMLFGEVNAKKHLLQILSDYPNEIYLKECRKRYQVGK